MAIKPNAATQSSGSNAQLYTGVAAFRVVGINPTQEELKTMGYKAEKAPVYRNDKGENRIVFFVEATAPGGHIIKSNVAFFVKDVVRKEIFINKLGKFSKDANKISGEVRNPLEGEIDLLGFIADWANINFKKEEELYLESIQKIASTGDVSEIREIHRSSKDNLFKGLATVADGKYQRVYNKRFARAWSTDYSYLHKSLQENQSYIKEDLGDIDFKLYIPDQFVLKPWTGQVAALADAAASASHSNGNGTGTATAVDDDDLPF